nr:non-structural protein 4A [Modoc virus]
SSVWLSLPGALYNQFTEAMDTIYVYYTANPSSKGFRMAQESMPTALLTVMQALIIGTGLIMFLGWMCSSRKVDRMMLGTLLIVGCSVTAWCGGVPLPLVSAMALVTFILLLCLVPEEGQQR